MADEEALKYVEGYIQNALREIAGRRRTIVPDKFRDLCEVRDGFSNMTTPKVKANMKLYKVSDSGGVTIVGSKLKIDEDGMAIMKSLLPKCSTLSSSLCVNNTVDIAVTVPGVQREMTADEIAFEDEHEDEWFQDDLGFDPSDCD